MSEGIGSAEFIRRSIEPNLQKNIDNSVKRFQQENNVDFNINNKEDRFNAYLGRLEQIFKDGDLDKQKRRIEIFKSKFVYPYVLIDKNNIPESYFELQKKIAEERGHGVVNYDNRAKQEAGKTLYDDQKASLNRWFDYLGCEDVSYANWFKYYALKSVVKLGNYDKEKHEFGKRTRSTTGIFPDLNREALAFTYDVVKKHYINGIKENNPDFKRILDSANFGKIYAYAIDKVTPASKENKEKTEGEWIKFNQGDDATPLYESLQGYGTGWCTAGEGVAREQLEAGDFYVYYSKDENNKNTIPRIAIRMQYGQVAEVRGIENSQNIETNMLDIAKAKYHGLPGGDRYEKKDMDMRLLTLIDQKTLQGDLLTVGELKFLYEEDKKIEGFGYGDDPRIEKIKIRRNFKEDLVVIYNCSPDQIVDFSSKINENTVVCLDRLDKRDVDIINNRKNPLVIYGDVDFVGCSALVSLPENMVFKRKANFSGTSLTSIPENTTFNREAIFSGCKNLASIAKNIIFNRDAYFSNCTSLTSIPENTTFKGDVYLKNCSSLVSISKNTFFEKMVSFEGCTSLTSIPENTTFNMGAYFKNCISLKSIHKNTILNGYVDFAGCRSLISVDKNVVFNGNVFVDDLTNKKIAKQLKKMERKGKIPGGMW